MPTAVTDMKIGIQKRATGKGPATAPVPQIVTSRSTGQVNPVNPLTVIILVKEKWTTHRLHHQANAAAHVTSTRKTKTMEKENAIAITEVSALDMLPTTMSLRAVPITNIMV